MNMISPLDAAVLDANSEELGVCVGDLMRNAAAAVAGVLRERFAGERIAFVCGSGNNGGDGIVAAGMTDPSLTAVFLLKPAGEIRSTVAREALSRLECPVRMYERGVLDGFGVLVDCALGTGFKGSVREPYLSYISDSSSFGGKIVSVDVPSGFGSGDAVSPHVTVALHDVKTGMTEDDCGEIIVRDIGIPEDAWRVVGRGDMLRYPIPGRESHKGDNGRVLVIGGGAFYGAPAMAAMAALRTGADLVRIAVPESSAGLTASFSPVFVVEELEGDRLSPAHVGRLLEASKSHDAAVIGPGLGTSPETMEAVREFVSGCGIPVAVDADGLTALGRDFKAHGTVVLTPHSGEFSRLGGDLSEGRMAGASDLAARTGATVLLKGPEDVIAGGGGTRINASGTPAMTGAGTGDVLSGIVGCLLSKGLSGMDAAALGAYISGKAGEMAFGELSYGLIATDVISRIPAVLRDGIGR
ncbi:MAG: NAD(P)H-hydrate dehydratase [Candidatus Methanoplasma sp.]|jgi:NAD(P)H-hydrate epimerase|nr:NAD(P)H-hydrate dehydratase [Candidatus Methanoplasma sp.]